MDEPNGRVRTIDAALPGHAEPASGRRPVGLLFSEPPADVRGKFAGEAGLYRGFALSKWTIAAGQGAARELSPVLRILQMEDDELTRLIVAEKWPVRAVRFR